jgi:ubiquinol-cytochrome c reductase iron-sulfur subunit
MNETRVSRWIALSFLLSAAASIALMLVYIGGGQPQAEGILVGASLGGIGVGLILWGKHLMPGGHFVQERVSHEATDAEQAAAADDLEAEGQIGRRGFLAGMFAVAAGSLGLAALFPIRSFGEAPGADLLHTKWEPGARLVTGDAIAVRPQDLELGGIVTVFPEGHVGSADSQTVLIRIDPVKFQPLEGREDWAPDGYVAYSKLCTHAGCPVGLFQAESNELFCPCHQSVFDVLDGAKPTDGPATRALPQLPLQVDEEGYIVATGDFSDPVGPTFWGYPE